MSAFFTCFSPLFSISAVCSLQCLRVLVEVGGPGSISGFCPPGSAKSE